MGLRAEHMLTLCSTCHKKRRTLTAMVLARPTLYTTFAPEKHDVVASITVSFVCCYDRSKQATPCTFQLTSECYYIYLYVLHTWLPSFFDFHSICQYRETPPETRPQAPVIQIPQMALKCRINEPLIVLLWQDIRT